jgi:hypothetical protein
MTDLEKVIAACEVAERAVKRRKTQAFTAAEEPVILAGLAAAPRLLVALLREEEARDYMDHTGTIG